MFTQKHISNDKKTQPKTLKTVKGSSTRAYFTVIILSQGICAYLHNTELNLGPKCIRREMFTFTILGPRAVART
jgi:hypothetical protein